MLPATWVHYITSCNTQSSASEDGQNNCPKHVELTGIISKPLLLHLFGCLYYLYQWCTVKQISDNEIYLLIKYIKRVLCRIAKRLSYIEDARCLKVKYKLTMMMRTVLHVQMQHGLEMRTDGHDFTWCVNFTLFLQMTYENQLDRIKDDEMGYGTVDCLQKLRVFSGEIGREVN